jgi:uncharacterized protein (TIGR00375 family)
MVERFIADLHIHSHFSVATSKDLDPEHLDWWARFKGLTVIGTGDFTHPGWTEELKSKLDHAECGLFQLKATHRVSEGLPAAAVDRPVRFVLSSELSTIYKWGDKTRKVHHVLLAPDFKTVEKIQRQLAKIGNITYDGRPILGLDSRDLLEIALAANPEVIFIPAHIWTPWFSALGDKSGFDSIDECYRDLAGHIHAIETGLSSDPPMNWRCTSLDRFTILSNSDAHSPANLGREANLFSTELSYQAIAEAIESGDARRFGGTIEFFPQEGKYHHDGHRKCNVHWAPQETAEHQGICPVCGKKVTVGVMSRVMELADREDVSQRPNRRPYYSMIPLREVLSEILGSGPDSKKVTQRYMQVVNECGSEFDVLLHQPLDRVQQAGGPVLAEAMRRMREGKVYIQEGYDGEYGVIKVFSDQEQRELSRQGVLFSDPAGQDQAPARRKSEQAKPRQPKGRKTRRETTKAPASDADGPADRPLSGLNAEQGRAASHLHGPALIIAGPGTGKTRVLTCRIVHLIENGHATADQILAVTFTRKAADEMQARLDKMLPETTPGPATVCTFHALGYSILREQLGDDWVIIDQEDKDRILRTLGCGKGEVTRLGEIITAAKQQLRLPHEMGDEEHGPVYLRYQDHLCEQGLLDMDDLMFRSVRLLMENPDIAGEYRQRYPWVLVDEYQDVNFAQYQLIRLLCPGPDANLCVIGDPNQAIYGFRGADVRFIRQFSEDYPGAVVYHLATSYRCSDTILQASRQVVTSEEGPGPSMLQGLPSSVKLQMAQHPTDKAEAEFVARTIERMIGGLGFFSMDSQIADGEGLETTQSLADFAILCRTSAQMPGIEKALFDHNIPFQRVGQEPFFRQEPVRSIMDLLRLAVSPENRFLRARLGEEVSIALALDPAAPAVQTIVQVVDAAFPDKKDLGQVKELVELAADSAGTTEDFVRSADLASPIDTYVARAEKVTLMTLHASKGLEFPAVFIVGCEDGLLPYRVFEDRQADLQEERRLLYVGMTRAKHWLYLTWAKSRTLYGRTLSLDKSPFLNAIEQELVEQSRAEYRRRPKKTDNQPLLFE